MYIWIGLAFIFLSIMETVVHHFNTSIFSKIRNIFWRKFFESHWTNKYDYIDGKEYVKKKGFVYIIALFDAYHVAKWSMIFCFAMAFGFDYVIGFACLQWLIHKAFYSKLWAKS